MEVRKKIVVLYSNDLFKEGIKALLSSVHKYCITGEFKNIDDTLSLINLNMPDALIIELSERDAVLNSFQLKNQFSSLQIIGIVDGNIQHLSPTGLITCFDGIMSSAVSSYELTTIMDKVLSGEKYISSDILKSISNFTSENLKPNINQLSSREQEILSFIAQGMKNQMIAEELFISAETVKTHKKKIIKKLNLKDCTELFRYAIEYIKNPPKG